MVLENARIRSRCPATDRPNMWFAAYWTPIENFGLSLIDSLYGSRHAHAPAIPLPSSTLADTLQLSAAPRRRGHDPPSPHCRPQLKELEAQLGAWTSWSGHAARVILTDLGPLSSAVARPATCCGDVEDIAAPLARSGPGASRTDDPKRDRAVAGFLSPAAHRCPGPAQGAFRPKLRKCSRLHAGRLCPGHSGPQSRPAAALRSVCSLSLPFAGERSRACRALSEPIHVVTGPPRSPVLAGRRRRCEPHMLAGETILWLEAGSHSSMEQVREPRG